MSLSVGSPYTTSATAKRYYSVARMRFVQVAISMQKIFLPGNRSVTKSWKNSLRRCTPIICRIICHTRRIILLPGSRRCLLKTSPMIGRNLPAVGWPLIFRIDLAIYGCMASRLLMIWSYFIRAWRVSLRAVNSAASGLLLARSSVFGGN